MRSCLKMLALVALASATFSWAKVASGPNDIVVLEPKDLVASARVAGESMTLHSLNNGLTYLYIEQQQLHRILVLDVTDPARIREVSTVGLDASGAFNFGEMIGFTGAVVRFQDGRRAGVMSFENPAQPRLSQVGTALAGEQTEPINQDGFLATDGFAGAAQPAARDYRVVDSSHPESLQLLATVKGVQATLVKTDTGTTFLLGQDGLTVIRRPSVELRNRLESTSTS